MRILLVDDDEDVRGLLRNFLETAGHEVVDAVDGEQALRVFENFGADLVLCDIFMPECDGLELILEMRRKFSDVRIIVMSGGGYGGSLDMLPVAKYFDASAVLYKPFGETALMAAIESVSKNVPARTPANTVSNNSNITKF